MKELTERYVAHFNSKDLDKTVEMFHEDAVLTDPVNTFSGKEEIKQEVDKIFQSCQNLDFQAKNIYCDEAQNVSIIEFVINLDVLQLKGTDVIQWQDGKIKEMRAYLNLP